MNRPSLRVLITVAALLSASGAVSVPAQSLAARVRSAPAGRIQFEFPARAGVCGDGQSFISTGSGSYYGSFNIVDGVASHPCTAGPVRTVINRADGVITSIETYVGPSNPVDGVTELGAVPANDATNYLISIANSADGRAARDAILPAAIADGTDISAALLALAGNRDRSLETRRAALSWAVRDDIHLPQVAAAVLHIARDENESQSIRQHALSVLARLPHGAGIPMLEQVARDNGATWAGEQSIRVLAQSGDPRARTFLREEVHRTDLPEETLAAAIRGLGSNYATGQDIELLRGLLPKLKGERSRATVLEAVARRGTPGDTQWLLGVARDAGQPTETRRRALDLVGRGGAMSPQIVALYDGLNDPALKESLIRLYAQSGDRASVDKLISIAKTDSNYTLRRRAVSSLSRTEDPRARQALQDIMIR